MKIEFWENHGDYSYMTTIELDSANKSDIEFSREIFAGFMPFVKIKQPSDARGFFDNLRRFGIVGVGGGGNSGGDTGWNYSNNHVTEA